MASTSLAQQFILVWLSDYLSAACGITHFSSRFSSHPVTWSPLPFLISQTCSHWRVPFLHLSSSVSNPKEFSWSLTALNTVCILMTYKFPFLAQNLFLRSGSMPQFLLGIFNWLSNKYLQNGHKPNSWFPYLTSIKSCLPESSANCNYIISEDPQAKNLKVNFDSFTPQPDHKQILLHLLSKYIQTLSTSYSLHHNHSGHRYHCLPLDYLNSFTTVSLLLLLPSENLISTRQLKQHFQNVKLHHVILMDKTILWLSVSLRGNVSLHNS